MSTPIDIQFKAEIIAAFEEWVDHSSSEPFEVNLKPLFESSSDSSEDDYINSDRQDELDWLTKRITYVFQKIIDPRERYEMRTLVEKNLSPVLGLYRQTYKQKTPNPDGYMPCQ